VEGNKDRSRYCRPCPTTGRRFPATCTAEVVHVSKRESDTVVPGSWRSVKPRACAGHGAKSTRQQFPVARWLVRTQGADGTRSIISRDASHAPSEDDGDFAGDALDHVRASQGAARSCRDPARDARRPSKRDSGGVPHGRSGRGRAANLAQDHMLVRGREVGRSGLSWNTALCRSPRVGQMPREGHWRPSFPPRTKESPAARTR